MQRTYPINLSILACLLMFMPTGGLWAANCAELRGFADPAAFPNVQTQGQAGACTMSVTGSGKRGKTCQWEYPFRADAAIAAYDEIAQLFATCFGNNALLPDDQQVNHPDSYALTQVQVAGQVISVSLKDKGAMQKSFVFLRLGPAPGN